MKKLLVLAMCVTILVAQASGRTPHPRASKAEQDRLVGAWRLAWLDQPGANGELHRTNCCGLLIFTRDGHISVQVMEAAATASGSSQYSQGGYEASYGTYRVDETGHRFTFHVEGSLVRSLIGKDLARAYRFSGTQLIVTSTQPDEHWRVAWERK